MFLMAYFLIACDKNSNAGLDAASPTSLESELVEQNVILTSGINFDTNEAVVFNPFTGQLSKPCQEKPSYSTKEQSKKEQPECTVKEPDIVAPAPVLDAIKNSREIFKGTIKRDGKEIPARFAIGVTALFEGSMCITHWLGGNEYQDCVTVKQRCNYYVSRPSRITSNIRATCSQFPGWPNQLIPLP